MSTNIDEIRTTLPSIDEYYKSSATRKRAKELVGNLTSEERDTVIQIIKESNEPLKANTAMLSAKLLHLEKRDDHGDFTPLISKDAGLPRYRQTLMNVWRAIKDFFGFRVSDEKLLKKIAGFTNFSKIIENDKTTVDQSWFPAVANVSELIIEAQEKNNYNQPILFSSDYQVLGIDLAQNFSIANAEKEYRSILKKNAGNNAKLQEAKEAFLRVYALSQIKKAFDINENALFYLKDIAEKNGCSEEQGNKIAFLCKICIKLANDEAV